MPRRRYTEAIYIPNSIDVQMMGNPQKAALAVNLILESQASSKVNSNGLTPISTDRWHRVIGKNSKHAVVNELETKGAILWDRSYVTKASSHSKHPARSQRFAIHPQHMGSGLKQEVVIGKYARSAKTINCHDKLDEVGRHMVSKFKEFYLDLPPSKTIWHETATECLVNKIQVNRETAKFSPNVGRFYSTYVNIPHAVRQYVALRHSKEPLYDVDVSCMQPLILGLELINLIDPLPHGTKRETYTGGWLGRGMGGEGRRGEGVGGGGGDLLLTTPWQDISCCCLGDGYRRYNRTLKSLEGVEELISKAELISNVYEWTRLAMSGGLYSFLRQTLPDEGMIWCKDKNDIRRVSRIRTMGQSTFKKSILASIMDPSSPNASFLLGSFPAILTAVRYLNQGGGPGAAAFLQAKESAIMIQGAARNLMRREPNLPFLTIHDAMLVPESNVETARGAIQDVFVENYGVTALIKTKQLVPGLKRKGDRSLDKR